MSILLQEFRPLGTFYTELDDDKHQIVKEIVDELDLEGVLWKYERQQLHPIYKGKKNKKFVFEAIVDEQPQAILNYMLSCTWTKKTEIEEQEDVAPKVVRSIPDEIYELLKEYFAYTIFSNDGVRVLLSRADLHSNTWKKVEDPIGWLQTLEISYKTEEGKQVVITNALSYLTQKLQNKQTNNETGWGVKDGCMYNFTDTFTKQHMEIKILEDERFYKKLATFTNAPDVPAQAYFPLHELQLKKSGTWAAWERFETQIPPNLIPIWRAAIYGIFDERNTTRQIIYMYDTGYSGKSSVASALSEVMGDFATALDKDALDSQFWYSGLHGKRLVVMGDTDIPNLASHPKIKQYTGGDLCRHEGKGQNSFSASPNGRIIAFGQTLQEVDITSPSEFLRILFFGLIKNEDPEFVKPFVHLDADGNPEVYKTGVLKGKFRYKGSNQFKIDLVAQIWDYLEVCQPSYNEHCPNHRDIAQPLDMFEAMSERCATEDSIMFTSIFDNYLEFRKDGKLANSEIRALLSSEHLKGEPVFYSFKKRLLDSPGVKNGGNNHRKEGERCCIGVCLRDEFLISSGKIITVKREESTEGEEVC